MTKWKRTGEEEQQSAVSSCGKKRQMAKRERAERRTSYTADILTAADARRERDEREGGREAGPADTHFLSRSLCVTQDRPISSQRSLTERLSLSPLAFQIVPSPLTRLTSAPPLPSPSAPFNTSLLTIVCLQNDNIAGRRQYYECHYSCYY